METILSTATSSDRVCATVRCPLCLPVYLSVFLPLSSLQTPLRMFPHHQVERPFATLAGMLRPAEKEEKKENEEVPAKQPSFDRQSSRSSPSPTPSLSKQLSGVILGAQVRRLVVMTKGR